MISAGTSRMAVVRSDLSRMSARWYTMGQLLFVSHLRTGSLARMLLLVSGGDWKGCAAFGPRPAVVAMEYRGQYSVPGASRPRREPGFSGNYGAEKGVTPSCLKADARLNRWQGRPIREGSSHWRTSRQWHPSEGFDRLALDVLGIAERFRTDFARAKRQGRSPPAGQLRKNTQPGCASVPSGVIFCERPIENRFQTRGVKSCGVLARFGRREVLYFWA